MGQYRSLSLIVCLTLVLMLSPARAQNSVRVAQATRVETAPTVDGLLDDPIWEQAEPIGNFVQVEPYEGERATEKTEVRILYDKETLFIGVTCYDTEPAKILVTDTRRDSSLTDMDSFQVILDTYHDRQNGFVFGTNPAGIEYDGQVASEGGGAVGGGGGRAGGGGGAGPRAQAGSGGGFNVNWDASWQVKTHVNEVGWMAEFAIPFRSLRYGSEKPQIWGVNFQRNIRRKREEAYWAPVSRIYNLYRLSSAGELHGLELEAPRNFKVTPYVIGSAFRNYAAKTKTKYDGEAGVDLKFGLTPSLNLDVTVNTDFAQVEVDEQQINLTRFNLFFPEKRPFFLENAGTFAVGKGRALDLFFSRRIGIDAATGREVPIIAGSRLSGKARNFNVGLLNMQAGRVGRIAPANNFTVARVSRELPNRSNIGAIFSNRTGTGIDAGKNNWNRTWALDGKLGIGEKVTFDGFAARTKTPGRTGRERALNLRGEYQRREARTHLEYTEVGEDFNPEVGFLTRSGYRSLETGIHTNVRFRDVSWLRELRPHVTYESFWDFEGFQESMRVHMDSHVDFESGAFFSPAVQVTQEGLKKPFEIYPGIVIPAGSYRNAELAWRMNTDRSARLSGGGELDFGGFYSGYQRSFGVYGNLRSGSNLNSSLRWRRNDIRLLEGAFKTNLIQWRFNYSFTPLIYLQSLVQYNDRANNWSANIRFGWLNTAGTGLFIVYNETQGLSGFGPINRSFIVKYTKQFDILR